MGFGMEWNVGKKHYKTPISYILCTKANCNTPLRHKPNIQNQAISEKKKHHKLKIVNLPSLRKFL